MRASTSARGSPIWAKPDTRTIEPSLIPAIASATERTNLSIMRLPSVSPWGFELDRHLHASGNPGPARVQLPCNSAFAGDAKRALSELHDLGGQCRDLGGGDAGR